MKQVVIEIDGDRHVLRYSSDFVCDRSCSLYDVCNSFDDYLCKLVTAVGVPDEESLGYYFELESKLED